MGSTKAYIGTHVGSIDDLSRDGNRYFEKGYRVFQCFMGDAKGFGLSVDKKNLEKLRSLISKGSTVIAHTSYPTSMARSISAKLWGSSMDHVVEIARVMNSIGGRYIVTHVGSIDSYADIEEGIENSRFFCEDFERRAGKYGVKLCLENDAGSNKGTRVGNIENIRKILEGQNRDLLGMCFDTEHAIASGINLEESAYVDKVVEESDIIHLNAVPKEVKLGSFIDKHSDTLIENSGAWTEHLLVIARKIKDMKKCGIMEKRSIDMVDSDIEFIERWSRDGCGV